MPWKKCSGEVKKHLDRHFSGVAVRVNFTSLVCRSRPDLQSFDSGGDDDDDDSFHNIPGLLNFFVLLTSIIACSSGAAEAFKLGEILRDIRVRVQPIPISICSRLQLYHRAPGKHGKRNSFWHAA